MGMTLWAKLKTLLGGQRRENARNPTILPASHVAVERGLREEGQKQPANKTTNISDLLGTTTLFFAGWGFREPHRKYRTGGGNEVLFAHVGDQLYLLRKMNAYILFRARQNPDTRAALFLTLKIENHRHVKVTDFPPQQFTEAVNQGGFGRCLLYIADFMLPHQCAYLFFAPDGSGFMLDTNEYSTVTFRWNDVTPRSWQEVLHAEPNDLRPLCKTIFDTQINPRMANAYIDPATLQNIPHHFECGSEEELRRLTVAIVQTEPGRFDTDRTPITVKYRAKTPTRRGNLSTITRGHTAISMEQGRMQSLCDLALRLNTFTGITWQTRVKNANRRGQIEKQIYKISVEVQAPSAHEQAESLLILADWLEGKVSPAKRLRLLGLNEETAGERTVG